MKKLLAIIIAICILNTAIADELKKILISQVVEHPALNKTTEGILAGLAAQGFVQDKNINVRIESAQANAAVAAQIANKFINQNPTIVVGVGTISAQSFIKYTNDNRVKLVFSSVTDPINANLEDTDAKNMPNISGVSNFVPLEPQLKMFKRLQPNLQTLGIIYNPGEINSASIVAKLTKVCQTMNIKLHKQAVTKTADVAQAAAKLCDNVDAIFISNDNTALSSLQSIIRAAQQSKIPVYVSDTDAVALGAVAALGPTQFEVGKQTGIMIAKILNGADINTLPIEIPLQTELVINLQAAQKAGITVPQSILEQASYVIGSSA